MEITETRDEGGTAGMSAPDSMGAPAAVLDGGVTLIGAEMSPVEGWLTRGLRALGLDRAVIFTVLARSWSSIAGVATLTLIAHQLTRAEQGYYYTFYSLVALQIVFELGFSTVILQAASHEAAHLRIGVNGPIIGPDGAHGRLASVLQKSVRWYTMGAVAMVGVLVPVGIWYFQTSPQTAGVHWLLPWCVVVVASGFTFQVDPMFSFLEGCGFVANVARVRLGQAMLGTVLGWGALVLHHGLLAPGLMIGGQAAVGGLFVARKRGLLMPLLRRAVGATGIDWRTEVWPFQWRIAVSWVCGFFITQLFNPVLFRYRGPVEAGRMGMSISICGTLTSLCVAWMNTKAPAFGRLIALGDFEGLACDVLQGAETVARGGGFDFRVCVAGRAVPEVAWDCVCAAVAGSGTVCAVAADDDCEYWDLCGGALPAGAQAGKVYGELDSGCALGGAGDAAAGEMVRCGRRCGGVFRGDDGDWCGAGDLYVLEVQAAVAWVRLRC